ncbi:GNAT family N-acetyltransferase [Microbacterium yannicii]|uniref:GNAT family N-acetyltransferase n=1 Tax=Microbacterium yannicii TaxID=671622 RepID=UPI00059014AD|nr:GNAT family N-acetyltransferase [Microbacterium yannicii]
MTAADWPDVERIYGQGIEDGEATFEVATPAWEAFDVGRLPDLRLVAVDSDGAIVGWIAASAVSSRPAYRGVVEHSVYIDRSARGRGIGRVLLDAFIASADGAGIWTIQSSIFPDNAASLRVHESAGFRVVGRRERIARAEIGPHTGRWRDTLLIERRSSTAGTD